MIADFLTFGWLFLILLAAFFLKYYFEWRGKREKHHDHHSIKAPDHEVDAMVKQLDHMMMQENNLGPEDFISACPKCGENDIEEINTKTYVGKELVYHYKCKNCGYGIEKNEQQPFMRIKKTDAEDFKKNFKKNSKGD